MDFGQAIMQFVNQNGVASAVLAFLGWFLVSKMWPFFTKEYWPTVTKRADAREALERSLRDALIEIKASVEKMSALMQSNDDKARTDRLKMVEMIQKNTESCGANDRTIIETVAALHVRLSNGAVPLATTPAVEARITQMNKQPILERPNT